MTALSTMAAFLRRDWETDISYRTAFGFQFVRVFLELALFFYLSQVVDNAQFAANQQFGGGYFAYVAVGLALLEIVAVSLSSFSRKLRDEQTTGTLEALLATPTSLSVIVLSSALYDILRATVTGLLVIATAVVVFGLHIDTDPASLTATVAALAGCIGLFASLGVAIAAFTVVFKRAAGVLGFVITALAFLGGVYFPISLLPGPIEAIARALPFTWGLDVARAGLLGGSVDAIQLAGLFAAVAVLLPATLLVFRASVWQARRTGTLAQY